MLSTHLLPLLILPLPPKMVALVSQDNVVTLVSRTGRQLQRYRKGRRQVVGCIPYRYKMEESEELEVLVISSQKGKGMLFPKGGWELDESKKEAAVRETIEEAGVRGIVGGGLGKWSFKSKTHDTLYEGYMFPLLVQEQLELWPEQNYRQRIWMSVDEAREVCQHCWMKEALDRLVNRLRTKKLGREKQEGCLKSNNGDGGKSDLVNRL
ncbi:nudix hydrolase 18, mitochondrial-like [Prosopis cineraria]|uniref:nudix hydrolase 18, mitochondrial-like n=1 Tax=Prosopis cineraria TaxID=364024 RepID=UPI00240F5118|nr:nudix hydrolase 18, mitochondrial-like [Prosopis cineraria]